MKDFRCLYEFGPFCLDPVKRTLLRSGEPVPLRPKVFDTLLVLVQNQQQLVEKDDLIRQIWGGTVVEEAGLTRNISVLRKILGETPGDHEYVVTVPGSGYRFVAPVREIVPAGPPVESQKKPASESPESKFVLPDHRWRVSAIVISAIVLVAVALTLLGSGSHRRPVASESSLMTLSPLTSYPGIELDPAFSPDGRWLAFAWDGGKREDLDIYVKSLPDGDPIRLTSGPGDERSPTWSPNGRYIASIRYSQEKGGIFVVPASGGTGQKVADWPQSRSVRYLSNRDWALLKLTSLAWMPDSKSLAFAGEDPEGGGNAIYVVSSDSA